MADLLPLQTGMLAVHIPTPEPAKDSDDDVRDAAAAPVMPPTTRLRLNLNKSAPPTVAAAGQSFARAPPAVSPPPLDRPAGPPRRLALRMMTRTSSQQVHCNDAPTMEPPVKVKGVEVDGGAVAAPSSNPLQHSSSVFHGSPARGPTPFDSTSVTYGVTQTATAPSSTVRPSTDAFPSSPNRTPEPYGVGRAPSAAVLVNRIPSKVPLDPIAPLHVAGTVWDKYKLERKIGEGTYGEVYYCTTKERINNVHVPVAVKKFKVLDHIEGIPTTTIREITILRSLTQRPSPCPNVTSLRDVVVSPDFTELYLVFDFAEHSLYGLLASRVVLDEGHYKCIGRQVLQGLVALHQEHIVHRDLKLNNILVDAHGCVKLCDFGLAFSTTSQRARVTPSLVSLPYRPPEMLFNRAAYNEAVDVWAFGCLLAQLFLGGSPPFMLSGGRVPASSEVEQLGLIAQAFDCSPWDLLTRETLAQCQPLWASTGGVSPPPEGLRRPPQTRCLTAHLNRLCAERNRRPVPPDVAEIICLALAPDPKDRPTAEQLMARPWFAVRSRDDDQERLSVAVRKGAGDRFCHSAPTRAEDA